jgi:hypothetical protein
MSADLERRMSALEQTVLRFGPLLELMATRIPPVIEKQWLVKKMEEEHYLTWSELHMDPTFATMFPYPSRFYYHANQMAVIRGWKKAIVEKLLYYYDDDFDIEAVRKKARWRNYRPHDPKFAEYLVKEVILPAEKPVNILDYLREAFPGRADNWHNNVIDSLAVLIKRGGYRIDRNGDTFSKTKRSTPR